MAKNVKARQGGQLNRSETLTVRLDPRLNYLCELGARSQRRTKSSLVEAALAHYLTQTALDSRLPANEPQQSIASAGDILWHVNEIERLRRLAAYGPHLMNYDEQRIWAVLSSNGYFWLGAWQFYVPAQGIFRPNVLPDNLIVSRVEEHWNEIKAVALEEMDAASLPYPIYLIDWDDRLTDATMAPMADRSESDRNG